MRLQSKKLVVGLFAAGAMLITACGGSDSGSAGGTETIRIARNNWTASAIEVEIVKQLIEKNLCNPVEILDIDENAMFAGMSSGDVDVNVEVWPSGVVPEEQAFIDDGSVVSVSKCIRMLINIDFKDTANCFPVPSLQFCFTCYPSVL